MNLCIESQSASIHCQPDALDTLVDRLERLGYEPLLRKAAHHFSSVFNATAEDLLQPSDDEDHEEAALQYEDRRRRLLQLEKLGYNWGFDSLRSQAKIPEVKGELFFTDDGTGILFITMVETSTGAGDTVCKLRVGSMGDSADKNTMQELVNACSQNLDEMGVDCEWMPDDLCNQTYQELAKAGQDGNLHPATSITEKELRAARALEHSNVREVAGLVRRAGVMLAKELLRQKTDQPTDTIKHVDQLLQAELAHQEYVVVCSKTGSHVNRVESREVIDQMTRLGVLCSCGKPISEEQIEGLLAADPLLPKMMDRNYWMAAMVVRMLNSLDIPSDKILVNTSPSSEDVEIFADVDGTLIMIEVKDIEFGLSQAYSLGTRVSVHRPQIAIVISTRGISNDVREHFKRIKPETQMVYVPNLLQMEAIVKKVIETVRAAKVKAWLNYFQGLLNFPLAAMLVPKLSSGSTMESPHVVTSVQIQPEAHSSTPVAASAPMPAPVAAAAPMHAQSSAASHAPLAPPVPPPVSGLPSMPATPATPPAPAAAPTLAPPVPPPATPANPPPGMLVPPQPPSMTVPPPPNVPMHSGLPTAASSGASALPTVPSYSSPPDDAYPHMPPNPSTALPSGLGAFGMDDDEFGEFDTEEEDASSQSPAVL
ncbi:MAG TPA: hypothetical protein V6C81_16610 [Planktothrix sp.]|jgi:hypothetical protein